MEGWLSMTIQKDLGEVLGIASNQPSSALGGLYEDDGSNLRVKLSKQGVVQIIKWASNNEPFVATLSDSVVFTRATISSGAAVSHQRRTGQLVTETLGNIIQIQNAEVVATHLGPRPSRITLFISSFKIVGSHGSGQFGVPRPFEATSEYLRLTEALTAFRTSDIIPSRPQVSWQSESISDNSRLRSQSPTGNNRYATQQLFSQVPTLSESSDPVTQPVERPIVAGQHPVAQTSSTTSEQSNQTAALMKMLKAKQPANTITKEALEQAEPEGYPPASLKKVTSAQQINPSAKAEASSAIQPEFERSMSASSEKSPKNEHPKFAPNKSKGKILSRDTNISNEQQKLLDQEDSWLPAEPGRRGPVANIPTVVLQEVTGKVEQRAAEKLRQQSKLSDQSPKQLEDLTIHDEIDIGQHQTSESPVPSADWPPSSPIPVRNELPPDSSIEMADCSDDDDKAHPQHSDKSIIGEVASRNSEVSSSSRRGSTASLAQISDPQPKVSVPSSSQADSKQPESHAVPASPALISHVVSSATQPNSNKQVESMAAVELTDSDSDIEMNVPLRLDDEDSTVGDLSFTQKVSATAFEPSEPFTQVKRTPYTHGREHQYLSQAEQQSSAPEIPSSPSKRRRIDGPGTAQIFGSNGFDDAQSVSPKSNSRQAPLRFAKGPFQTQFASIEETVLSHQAQSEALLSASSAADRVSNTSSPVHNLAQEYDPSTNVTSQVVGQTNGQNGNSRCKFESPILSPHVSKRRKRHKSPTTFKLSQEEFPKEDPSITARRYRREFFASRKNSRSESHTLLHENGPNNPSRPSSGTLAGLAAPPDTKTSSAQINNASGVLYDIRDQPDVLRSSLIQNGSYALQDLPTHGNNVDHTGEKLDEISHATPTPPTVDPKTPFPANNSNYQTSTRVPIVVSVGPSSLPAQSIQADLQNVSTKLEGLSGIETSQQTDRSGQAQSIPELMTPALSVADIPQRASPAIKSPAISQGNSSKAGIFSLFRATYPEYLGTEEHFVGMCRRIHQLVKADRMEHKSLWDDFVVRHKTDYPQYYQQCMDNAEDPKPYERFYREEIDEPKYSKRVLQPSSLGEVMPIDQAPPATQGADLIATTSKRESPKVQLGAQPTASPDYRERSDPIRSPTGASSKPVLAGSTPSLEISLNKNERLLAERQVEDSPERSTILDHSDLLDSRETVDLTGDQSSSPTPAPHPRLSELLSGRIEKRSPRKIPWQEHEIRSETGGTRDGTRGSHWQRSPNSRTLNVHATDHPQTSARSSNNELTKSRSQNVNNSGTTKAQRVKLQAKAPYHGSLSGRSPQGTPGDLTASRITRQKPTNSNRNQKSRPESSATAVDEWWKDDNTPFREYVKLYQSITPGKGNAWAKQKEEPRARTAEEDEDKKAGSGREESPELGSMDVMKWRL
ncbi:MAG: hypothetical protein Q9216_002667 [Gyalolechia sp. 2 TL-2023]